MNQDFRDLLAEFNARGVEYLVVGAHALAAHGHRRTPRRFLLRVPATSGLAAARPAAPRPAASSGLALAGECARMFSLKADGGHTDVKQ
jgi:hypothetical protein